MTLQPSTAPAFTETVGKERPQTLVRSYGLSKDLLPQRHGEYGDSTLANATLQMTSTTTPADRTSSYEHHLEPGYPTTITSNPTSSTSTPPHFLPINAPQTIIPHTAPIATPERKSTSNQPVKHPISHKLPIQSNQQSQPATLFVSSSATSITHTECNLDHNPSPSRTTSKPSIPGKHNCFSTSRSAPN